MGMELTWVRERLLASYPDLDAAGGVDLDGDGSVQGGEVADTDSDHVVSADEALTFFTNNREALSRLIPYFSFGSSFSPDNPVHQLIHIESQISTENVASVYSFLTGVLASVRSAMVMQDQSIPLPPSFRMMAITSAVRASGVQFIANLTDSSFINGITQRRLDCDTSTFILLAMTHELGWPVRGVMLPTHFFARWVSDEEHHYNYELFSGASDTDEQYIERFHLDQSAIDNGAYFNTLTDGQLAGVFYMNAGSYLIMQNRFEESLTYLERSVELYPSNSSVYNVRGNAYKNLSRYDEAVADFNRAIELDPSYAVAYYNMGIAKGNAGRFEEAIEDFNSTIGLDYQIALVYMGRAAAFASLRRYEEALADYARVIEMEPQNVMAYYSRGLVKLNMGHYEEAIADFDKVLEIDPAIEAATQARAIALSRLENH